MFDGLFSNRFGGDADRLLDAFEGFTGTTRRFTGTAEPVETVQAFGAVASYQVCGCCARFHGATSAGEGGAQGVAGSGVFTTRLPCV